MVGPGQHDQRHGGHEQDAERDRGDPRAIDREWIVHTDREANPDGRSLRKTQRHHEGGCGALKGDLMGGKLNCANPAHEKACGRKETGFHHQGHGDREAKTPDLGEALPIGPPKPPKQAIAAELPIQQDEAEQTDQKERTRRRMLPIQRRPAPAAVDQNCPKIRP